AHSATHVLHKALRSVLGPHAEQTGSLVEPDRLRFDFSHPKALTPAELAEIDRMANDAIYAGLPVDAREMPLAEARSLGATALFGEKYGDIVRLVKMGNYSLELCGGTHVDNTSKIGAIKITSEASSAAGVRRIEAKTGRAVLSDYDTMKLALQTAAGLFHAQPAELVARATQALEELRQMRKQFNDMRSKDVLGGAEQILQNASDIEGLKVATAVLDGVDAAALRKVGDWLRDKEPSVVAVLAIREGEKATFFAVSGKEAVRRGILAGDLVREVCRITGGKGGGKAESAMGGGKDPAKVEEALRAVESYVREHIK
ncbi:DHHA1 domain-containing protein, partial [Oscillospiraceae bacterium OttesenSCG-928-G22]|nr:DHHA1 domain-containing protein [Oscillospiraceae bacterium OttesenSCG-928-G22]